MIEPPTGLDETDFEAIEAAVLETARGRWFLAEYARRCRAREAERILSAVDRLEGAAEAARAQEAGARRDAERAAELVRQLAELVRAVKDGGLVAGSAAAATEPQTGPPPAASAAKSPARGSLEARLQALVSFDRLPLAQKLELLG
jgi:hypothetical protein